MKNFFKKLMSSKSQSKYFSETVQRVGKNNAGFSLVELIVVIAIMAILAAVAVIGVSVYIPKAQKAADEQLVADIEQALNLSMQSQPITDHPIGKLVLSTEGIKYYAGASETPLAGTDVEEILINAFGSDYQNKLKLKFDEWTSNPLITGIQMGEADAVKGSSYLSGERSDMLLQDVEKFTGMANNLAGGGAAGNLGVTLGSLYGDALLDKTAEKYGIKKDDSMTWDQWGEAYPDEFSNLLVLATAMNSEDAVNGDAEMSEATSLIMGFSTYYAFAATCPDFSEVLTQFMDAMNSDSPTTNITSKDGSVVTVNKVNTPADGAAWKRLLEAEAAKPCYVNKDGKTYNQYLDKQDDGSLGEAALADQMAFIKIMASLNNVAPEDVSGQLGNNNLFTDGAVKDKYDEYMNALDIMAGYEGDFSVNPGEIAIIYNQGTYTIVNSIK